MSVHREREISAVTNMMGLDRRARNVYGKIRKRDGSEQDVDDFRITPGGFGKPGYVEFVTSFSHKKVVIPEEEFKGFEGRDVEYITGTEVKLTDSRFKDSNPQR